MPLISDNPFASLSLIAAPAILTNASSVLALGTSNRFARAIDRARALSILLEKEQVNAAPITIMRVHQLNRLEKRSLILLHALRSFYLALGSFAASALISLIGSSLTLSIHHLLFRLILWYGLATGAIGVGAIVFGCSLLVGETRLAVQNVAEEAKLVRERFKEYLTASENAGEPG